MGLSEMIDWKPSDDDAFLISVPNWVYYYAIEADLNGNGSHYYKVHKKTHEMIEVKETEIVEWVLNRSDKIYKKCPCVVIENGHLRPLIERV